MMMMMMMMMMVMVMMMMLMLIMDDDDDGDDNDDDAGDGGEPWLVRVSGGGPHPGEQLQGGQPVSTEYWPLIGGESQY